MAADDYATATFSGGCFWCSESDFEKLPGVVEVISGYTGGAAADAVYQQVASGQTEHIESVQVVFEADKITYDTLLEAFWRHIDPTDAGGQFADRGNQYRSVIFYQNEAQRLQAEKSRDALSQSGRFNKPLVTEILPAMPFYPAEDYHQNYYRENPVRYRHYRHNSGRDQFLETVWGREVHPDYVKPDQQALRQTLTPLEYEVTQQDSTEPPFNNTFWDNKTPGLYVDVVTGEPFFPPRTSLIRGPAGPVLLNHSMPNTWWKKPTESCFRCARKCAVTTVIPIWGMCLKMARRRGAVCGIALIQQRCGLSPPVSCHRLGMRNSVIYLKSSGHYWQKLPLFQQITGVTPAFACWQKAQKSGGLL